MTPRFFEYVTEILLSLPETGKDLIEKDSGWKSGIQQQMLVLRAC